MLGAGSYHNIWYPGGKLPPNPHTSPNPSPNHNQGAIFLRGNCLVAPPPPTLKLTLTLNEKPNPNRWGRGGGEGGQFSMGDNCPDTVQDRI